MIARLLGCWRRDAPGLRAPVFAVVLLVSVSVGVAASSPQVFDPDPDSEAVPADAVEVPGFRTESSRTYRLENGRFTTVVSAGPVNFRGADGRWQPIDNTLVASDRGGFAWENRANAYSVLLPSRPGREPVRFEHEGAWVSFSLRNVPSVAPTVDKETARVVLSGGVSVRWIAGNTELKEELVLASAQATSSFTFDLRLSPGLTPGVRSDGSIDFLRADGEHAFSFVAPFMVDSSGTEEGFSDAVSYELEKGEGGYVLRLVADAGWLSDPARVWPVTIDPTITIEQPMDCHISSGSPNVSACGQVDLKLGLSGSDKRRLLLKFTLPEELQGHTVTDADLALWCEGGTTGNNAFIDVRRATKSWTNGATWNKYNGTNSWTSPGGDFGGTDAATRETDCASVGWKLWTSAAGWSIAGLVNSWLDGTYPNQGVLMKQQGENVNNLLTFTATNDAANPSHWPELRLTFSNTVPAVPTLEAPAAGADAPMITPVLTATDGDPDPVHDADGDELSYQFEVADDSAFTQSRCVSPWLPTTNTWTTAPADCALEDGDSYYWRARAKDPFQTSAWSSGRPLDVRLPKLGASDLWPMWSHDQLSVNLVNGNLVLPQPGPSYATALGSMGVGLTYNSLEGRNRGLGPGWTLNAGDDLSNPPSELIDHGLMEHEDGYDAIEVVYPGGFPAFFTHVGDSNTYISEPGDGSQLTKNEDGTWTLLDVDGSIYTFGAADAASFTATLASAELVSSAPGDWGLTYAFSTLDPSKITAITDPASRQLEFDWNSLAPTLCPAAILCITGPDGVTWRYIGDASGGTSGRLVNVNNGTRDLFTVTYESAGSARIVKLQNANDLDPASASPGYDGDHSIEISYDGSGRVDDVSEGPITGQTPSTSTWTFGYFPGAVTTPRTSRGADGFATVTPPRQQGMPSPATITRYYDARGREIETVDLLGNITATEYNENDQVVWSQDEAGAQTDFLWDEHNHVLLSETAPDPDGAGPLGRPVTSYRYDEKAIGSAGSAGPALEGLQASYYTNGNLAGRPESRRNDANVDFATGGGWPNLGGQTTGFSVRWTGNLMVTSTGDYEFSTVATDGTRLTVDGIHAIETADRIGPVTTSTAEPITLDAGPHRIMLEYLAKATSGAQVELRWLGPGISDQVVPASALRPGWMNETSAVSPSGNVTFSHFADPASMQPDYQLEKLGGTNVITSYTYDSAGRTTQKVMPKGNASRTIDANGNLTGTPDTSYATAWAYYGLAESAAPPAVCGGGPVGQAGALKSLTPAGIAATTSVYDAGGRPIAVTSGAGTQCSSYDAEGRLTSSKAAKTYGGSTYDTTTYTYDPAGAQRSASMGSLTTSTEYDEAGRPRFETDAHGAELAFTYDPEGNVIERAATPTATTFTTEYVYDAASQLTLLTDPAGEEYAFTYDNRGLQRTAQYPNGTFTWMDFNTAGWLTGLYHRHGTLPTPLPGSVPLDPSPIADYAYSYDIEGRKTEELRSGGGLTSETTSYTSYDALDRLAEVFLPNGTCRKYLYDLDSNRAEIKEGATCGGVSTVETYAYSATALDQLTSVTKTGQPATSFTYKTGGEVATRGGDTLTWDGHGRHTGGTFGSTTVSYAFDPLGFRHERTVGSQTTRYLSGGLFEKDGSGITLSGVDGPAGDLAHYAGRPEPQVSRTYLYYNGHGHLAAKTDASGTRTDAYTYDPFGAVRDGSVPSSTTSEHFTGKWNKKHDPTSGLIEMGVRPYDPAVGRFYAVDPIEGGSLNNYEYAGQDPVNAYDLTGRAFIKGAPMGGYAAWRRGVKRMRLTHHRPPREGDRKVLFNSRAFSTYEQVRRNFFAMARDKGWTRVKRMEGTTIVWLRGGGVMTLYRSSTTRGPAMEFSNIARSRMGRGGVKIKFHLPP